jgi:twitching motility protein PilI
MANREVLRALQGRLADRLQAAKSESASVSWLAVKAAGLNYLFSLAQSGEIFPLPALQVVPYTQPWFLGVANLRGGLHGVVDFAAFIDANISTTRSFLPSTKASVISFGQDLDVNCALKIDALLGLRHAENFAVTQTHEQNAPPFFGNLYQDQEGQNWQEVDLQLLAQHPQFLSINT